MALHAIVLAAGKGTRMKSDLAKVLHEAAGRTLLDWSLSALGDLPLESIAVVVGHQATAVTASVADHDLAPLIATALQSEQLGTGHATRIGLEALTVEPDDTIVVMPGDMPLLRKESMAELLAVHGAAAAAASVATAELEDPTGYGRIIRSDDRVVRIVEQADATEQEAAIREVNTSVYAFDAMSLADRLSMLSTDNAQGEQYLTDVVAMLAAAGEVVVPYPVDPTEAMGVNTVAQLETAAEVLRGRE